MNKNLSHCLVCFVGIAFPFMVNALPDIVLESATEDDAMIQLAIYDEFVAGDSVSYCSLRLIVDEFDVVLSKGDKFSVFVYSENVKDDVVVFSLEDEPFTAEEVGSGNAHRVIDCSAAYPAATGSTLNIYARALVIKEECGFTCTNDEPVTNPVTVAEVGDDAFEENDTQQTAAMIGLNPFPHLIAADDDWFQFDLAAVSRVNILTDYQPDEGRLDMELFDANSSIAIGADQSDGGSLGPVDLPAGQYTLHVVHRETGNTVFYDLDFQVTDHSVFGDRFELP